MDERGRPTLYTPEIAKSICSRLSNGETLKAICRDENMPHESTVRAWAIEDRSGFSTLYAKAREIGYQCMADELIEIADDGRNDWMERNDGENAGWQANGEHVQRSRLRLDTRKWLLSKALPKVYGDKVDLVSSDGSMTPKGVSDDLAAALDAIAGKITGGDGAA